MGAEALVATAIIGSLVSTGVQVSEGRKARKRAQKETERLINEKRAEEARLEAEKDETRKSEIQGQLNFRNRQRRGSKRKSTILTSSTGISENQGGSQKTLLGL